MNALVWSLGAVGVFLVATDPEGPIYPAVEEYANRPRPEPRPVPTLELEPMRDGWRPPAREPVS